MKIDQAYILLKKIREGYDTIAQHFSVTRAYLWPEFEALQKYINEGDRVLDIGCGNGRLSEIFRKIKADYVGADFSEKMIAQARKKYPKEKFVVADVLKLPQKPESFDAVFMIAVLQHVPSQGLRKTALKNVERVLKNGGYLLMTNWNLWQKDCHKLMLKHYLKKLIGKSHLDFKDIYKPWKSPEGKTLTNRYFHAFTCREIRMLLEKTGFQVISNYYSLDARKEKSGQAHNIFTVAKKI